jgi:tetratricopeptide (TPR) repeat protein
MKNRFLSLTLAAVMALPAVLLGQEAAGPQPKSQEELDAIMAVQNSQDPDGRIQAADDLLKKFADTEFKAWALQMQMLSYQQKNDFDNMLVYGERALEADPENAIVMIQLAYAIPSRTREFDLDKDEKLAKAEDLAKRAMAIVPVMPKHNPQIPDEEWLLVKKDFMSQAHESLGMVSLLRKDYPGAEGSLRKALEMAVEQQPQSFYQLANALKEQGKYDEALTTVDQAIAKGGVPTSGGGDAAQNLKKQIQALKASGAPPPSQPKEPAVPQVEIIK